MRVIAVATLATLMLSACVTNVYVVQEEATEDTGADSFPGWTPPAASSSSGDAPADESTSADTSGSTSGDTSDGGSTSAASTGSTGDEPEASTSSTSAGDETTGDVSNSTGDGVETCSMDVPTFCSVGICHAPSPIGDGVCGEPLDHLLPGSHVWEVGKEYAGSVLPGRLMLHVVDAFNLNRRLIIEGTGKMQMRLYQHTGAHIVGGEFADRLDFPLADVGLGRISLLIGAANGGGLEHTVKLEPTLKPGEGCASDNECEGYSIIGDATGWCGGNVFDLDAPPTCTRTCTIDVVDSCQQQGVPGVCVQGGGYLHCSGSWTPSGGFLITPETEPPNLIQWSGNAVVYPDEVHASLVPPQPYAFKLTTGCINDVGWGVVALDVYTAYGELLGSVVPGESLVVHPNGKHHHIIARPIQGKKSHYSIYLNTP